MNKRLEGLLIRLGGICLVALCLISCKDEESNQVSVKVTEANLCNEVAEVMCHNIFECCEYRSIEARFGVENVTSKSACLRDVKLSCEDATSELRYAIDKKRASINVATMEACLKSLVVGDDGCFPVLNEFATQCSKDLVKGKQGEGKECLNDFECAADGFCGGDMKCHSLLAQGEACSVTTSICKPGLYCTLADGDTTSTCRPLKSAGEACTTSSECGDNLYCDRANDVCAAYKAIGELCDNTTPCESGNCLSGTCPDGDLCADDYDCGTGYCEMSGGTCETDADCGGTCENSGYSCSADYPCSNACLYNGDTCDVDDDCFYGECAVSGDSCYDDASCGADDYCDYTGQCQPDTCATDRCIGGGTCEGRVCGPKFVYPDFCAVDVIDYIEEVQSPQSSGVTPYDDF